MAYLQQLADGLHFLAMDPDTVQDPDERVNLAAWWSQAGALLAKAVPKHVRVVASFPADLPDVRATEHALTQAVLNLVVNAGEAIAPPARRTGGHGLVRVFATLGVGAEGEKRVRLTVTDNGHGMTEEVKRRAFEMFFTTKPRGLGTGLGLALVRKVAERAGGRVELDSEAGKGTTVVIVVPAARTTDAGPGAASPRALISVADGRAAGLLRHLLESSGAVVQADDPFSAHIWVLDPSGTALDAAKTWRRKRPDGRLVLFGRPDAGSAGSWKSLEPVTIETPDDFEAVRSALTTVLAPAEPAD